MTSNRAEERLEETDRLKRAALEQRNQSELVDREHLAEIARLEEANREVSRNLERERRELEEERKRAQERDGEARSAEKAIDKTRRYRMLALMATFHVRPVAV